MRLQAGATLRGCSDGTRPNAILAPFLRGPERADKTSPAVGRKARGGLWSVPPVRLVAGSPADWRRVAAMIRASRPAEVAVRIRAETRRVKVVGFEQFGGPEALAAHEVPGPHAGAGSVRVRVAAFAVNPTDRRAERGISVRRAPAGSPRRSG